jgi:multiple sugar transport system substrate-binding protein
MRKKSIALLLISCLALGALTGCSTNDGKKPSGTPTGNKPIADPFPGADLKGVTIKVQGLQNPYKADAAKKDMWRERQEEVEKKFNVKLEFDATDGIDWNSVPEKLVASVAAGDPLFDIGNASRYYIAAMVNGDAIMDLSQEVSAFNFPKPYYEDMCQYQGKTYGFSSGPNFTWSILAYNRNLIKQAGMEKLPEELFKEGKWSYDDFYNYLTELRSKLPQDVNILGIHALTMAEMFGYANGAYLMNPKTYIPEYNKEPMIQTIQFFQKLVQNKLAVNAFEFTRDDGSIGYNWNEVKNGNMDGKLVFWSGNTWEFAEYSAKFDWGIVPPPYGPQVTIKDNDYKTLSSNYRAFAPDGGIWVIPKTSKPKATPEQYMNLIFSYDKEAGEQLLKDREKQAKGEAITSRDAGKLRDFTSDLNVELWDWYQTRSQFEPMNSSQPAPKPFRTLYKICALNIDPRAEFDAIIGEDLYGLIDAKLVDPNSLSGDLKKQYDDYVAANPK